MDEFSSEDDLDDNLLRDYARQKFRDELDASDEDDDSDMSVQLDLAPTCSKTQKPKSATPATKPGPKVLPHSVDTDGPIMPVANFEADETDDMEESVGTSLTKLSRPLGTSAYYGGEEATEHEDEEMELRECARLQKSMFTKLEVKEDGQRVAFLQTDNERCANLLITMDALHMEEEVEEDEADSTISTEQVHQVRDHLRSHGFPAWSESSETEDVRHARQLIHRLSQELSAAWQPLHESYVDTHILHSSSIAALTIHKAHMQADNLRDLLKRWLEKRVQGMASLDKSSLLEAIKSAEEERRQTQPAQRAFLELVGLVLLKHCKSSFTLHDVRKLARKSPGPEEFLRCLDECNVNESDGRSDSEGGDDFDNQDPSSMSRPITKEMFENKGLATKSARRARLERNPRVNLRRKHKKALIKRNSVLPPTKKESTLYQGETRGIRAGLIKSVKF